MLPSGSLRQSLTSSAPAVARLPSLRAPRTSIQTNRWRQSLSLQSVCMVAAAEASQSPALPSFPRIPVQLVATDVDGTLLNSNQELIPRVRRAVLAAVELGVPVVVATGKARGPWAARVLPLLGPAIPGVFMQGLLIYDGEGNIIYSRELEEDVALEGIAIAKELGLTLAAYCGDRILTEATDTHTDRLIFYGEPTPESHGSLEGVLCQQIPCQKYILMGSQERIEEVRAYIEGRLGSLAHLTSALPGMLEVLPKGASKGDGLERLLKYMGVEAAAVLACGDGENDVEMLRMAGYSVAMGNAGQPAREAADYTVCTNDEGGVAEAIERFVLKPRGVVLE